MQSRVVYVMLAGLAVGMLCTASPKAVAGDDAYFKVLAPNETMPAKLDTVSRLIETATSYPIVIERVGKGSAIIERTSMMPVILERTSVARPPSLPFCFGVWP